MEGDIPQVGKSRLVEIYFVWFVIVSLASGLTWNQVQSYNPEGTGLFN